MVFATIRLKLAAFGYGLYAAELQGDGARYNLNGFGAAAKNGEKKTDFVTGRVE